MTTERTAAAWREPQIAEPYVLEPPTERPAGLAAPVALVVVAPPPPSSRSRLPLPAASRPAAMNITSAAGGPVGRRLSWGACQRTSWSRSSQGAPSHPQAVTWFFLR